MTDKETMIELKECPFCGGKAVFRNMSTTRETLGVCFNFSIKCQKCGLAYPESGAVRIHFTEEGTLSFIQDDRHELTSKWNARAVKV